MPTNIAVKLCGAAKELISANNSIVAGAVRNLTPEYLRKL